MTSTADFKDLEGGMEKPTCFGCYGYRICVSRTTPPSSCPWEERCYNYLDILDPEILTNLLNEEYIFFF